MRVAHALAQFPYSLAAFDGLFDVQDYVQALALGRPTASVAALDKTSKLLQPGESLALRRMYARDPDDKIKVDDPTAMRRQSTDFTRIFGLGPFGEVLTPEIFWVEV